MDDIRQLTDEQLKDRFYKLDDRMGHAAGMTALATCFCILGALASFGLLAVSATTVVLSVIASTRLTKEQRLCGEEQDRRRQVAVPAPAPTASFPAAAKDFNPAAATVLENDMQPMSPLRLKKLAAKYVGMSNG